MRAIFVVTELVKHCMKNLIKREEIQLIIRSAQSKLNLCPSTNVEP